MWTTCLFFSPSLHHTHSISKPYWLYPQTVSRICLFFTLFTAINLVQAIIFHLDSFYWLPNQSIFFCPCLNIVHSQHDSQSECGKTLVMSCNSFLQSPPVVSLLLFSLYSSYIGFPLFLRNTRGAPSSTPTQAIFSKWYSLPPRDRSLERPSYD